MQNTKKNPAAKSKMKATKLKPKYDFSTFTFSDEDLSELATVV